uniref:DUF1279 domain-containing protein n=1 Tax=Steinernema glaseri TaxID=37863 RepID=A0A1I8AP53_9BILA
MNRRGTVLLTWMPSISRHFAGKRLCATLPSGSRNPCQKEKVKRELEVNCSDNVGPDYKNSGLLRHKISSTFTTMKYYFKKHWYIAVPIHCVSCSAWFAGLYLAVRSGVDVVSILEYLHIPENWIESIKNAPPSAGHFFVAAILYKIATPGRYATTLAGIQLAFWILGRRLR